MGPVSNRAVLLLTHAVALAVLSRMAAPDAGWKAGLGFLVAGLLLLWGLDRSWAQIPVRPERSAEVDSPLVADPALRRAYLVTAAVFLAIAFAGFGGNTFTVRGVGFWICGTVCFLVGVWERPRRDDCETTEGDGGSERGRTLLVLAVVMLIAVFFRFHSLDLTPIEMTSDHCEKLVDVHEVLEGQRPIFFERNTGREAIQFYVTALLIRCTDMEISHLALKVGTGLFGLMAIPFTFLLGRELYGRNVGLMAAGLMAVSHWHVAITRVGLRFPFTAAFVAPVLYFLFRAFRLNLRRDWILVGVFLGVGLHTYIPMRMVPLLLVALCAAALVMDWVAVRTGRAASGVSLTPAFWTNAVIGAATSLVFFLPLARYMLEEPGMFWLRSATRAVPDSMTAGEVAGVFIENLRDGAMMFTHIGDRVAMNTVGGSPFLGWVTGGLFVLGLWFMAWSLVRSADRRSVYLVLCLGFMILPSVLSIAFPNENPSAVRAGGAIPLVMVIAALPLNRWLAGVRSWSESRGRAARLAAPVGLAVVAAACIAYNHHWYFVRYHDGVVGGTWNTRDLGDVLRQWTVAGRDPAQAYQVIYPHWVDTRLIGIHAGDVTWSNALGSLENLEHPARPGSGKLFFLHPDDDDNLSALVERYPSGRWQLDPSSTPGREKEFVVFEVPPAADSGAFLIVSPGG